MDTPQIVEATTTGTRSLLEGEKVPEPNAVLRFFAHPAVGITGSIASILSFALAFYFYYASQATRELTCQVDTATTQSVKLGKVPN